MSAVAPLVTLLAVLVALFMRELRAWLLPPVLEMDLADANGVAVTVEVLSPGAEERGVLGVLARNEKARYYHLRVSNPRRTADVVNGVTVTLLRVQRRGEDDGYHDVWSGDIPLTWRNETTDTQRRTIGTWAHADLCHVVRNKWLWLALRIFPADTMHVYRRENAPFDLVLTVRARGNEVDSEEQRWRVYWDGGWEDGEVEMRRHFHVTRLP